MHEEDRKFILEAISHRPQKADVYDHISKIAVTICSAGILYLANVTVNVQQDIALIKQSQEIAKEEIISITKFTEVPRFTKDDYDRYEAKQNDILMKITQEMEYRRGLVTDLDKKFTMMERDFDLLKRDIEDMREERRK